MERCDWALACAMIFGLLIDDVLDLRQQLLTKHRARFVSFVSWERRYKWDKWYSVCSWKKLTLWVNNTGVDWHANFNPVIALHFLKLKIKAIVFCCRVGMWETPSVFHISTRFSFFAPFFLFTVPPFFVQNFYSPGFAFYVEKHFSIAVWLGRFWYALFQVSSCPRCCAALTCCRYLQL